jgi:hypothetical protein
MFCRDVLVGRAGIEPATWFHVEDPVRFQRSIKVTIEHGHANRRSDDYSSTAYWYQSEPHATFPPLPAVADRVPRPDDPNLA